MYKIERLYMDALFGCWNTAAVGPNNEKLVLAGQRSIELYCRETWKLAGRLGYPLPIDRAIAVIQGRI